MGFWDFLRRSDTTVGYMTPNVEYVGGPEWVERVHDLTGTDFRDASAAQLWRTQPHLRTVVSFLARNVAQLGLHTFERVDETDRRRDRTSPVAGALQSPDTNMTGYDLIYATVGDMALYDTAYWALKRDPAGGFGLRRLPPSWVSEIRDNPYEVTGYRVSRNNQQVTIPATEVLSFSGYAPTSPGGVSPTIAALKETLAEQMEASRFRNQVWKRGGRVSAVIERPAGAEWSAAAMERFSEDWHAKYTGNGPRAGGTPILEDGMKLNRIDFSASEQQFVEGAKLSFSTVAAAFHVNPTMVGILDNANYSNVREFRRMLYGDTLGPMLAQIEARVNTLLLPMLGMDPDRFYVEFNIAEKLQGSFEEQAAVMSTLVGRPVLTADEARAKFNMPALGGNAAELVTPLNVLVGGQASSRDSAPPPAVEAGGPVRQIKAAPRAGHVDKAAEVLSGFFARQQASVIAKIGAGPDWWDGKRWDRELSADLLPLSHSIAETIGKAEAERLGYTAGAYDGDQTVNFLTAVAGRYAKTVNDTTQGQLKAALAADEDPTHVFTVAKESRAAGVGQMVTTFAAGFGTVEAAKQIAQGNNVTPTKTWITGSNPRPAHAAMDGQTVAIDDVFSDGNEWPGGLPGCNCSVSVDIP